MKRLFLLLLTGWILCLCACAGQPLPEDVIDTEYFTLPLPVGVSFTILPDGDRYAIEFYENQDYQTSGTGKLCTLKLFKEGEDFTTADHTAYGTLVTKKETFQLVVHYPAEITYTPANANQHKELLKQIDFMIIYSLEPKNGCKWLVPQLEGPPISDVVIETQYYTVNLPQDWVDQCIYEITLLDDGTEALSFYEKESYEDFGGGLIGTIRLLPENVDWGSVSGAGLFGSLKTPDSLFTIVWVKPAEKQFTKQTRDTYEAMQKLSPYMFNTFTPKDGCTLNRA